jgi:hypothetical protein
MMPSSFVDVVIHFRPRLEMAFGECYIDALEEEHRSLRDRYLRDPQLKDMLDSMTTQLDTTTRGCHCSHNSPSCASSRVAWLPSIQEQ